MKNKNKLAFIGFESESFCIRILKLRKKLKFMTLVNKKDG